MSPHARRLLRLSAPFWRDSLIALALRALQFALEPIHNAVQRATDSPPIGPLTRTRSFPRTLKMFTWRCFELNIDDAATAQEARALRDPNPRLAFF